MLQLAQLPCAVLVTDRAGRILAANAAWAALVGEVAQGWEGRAFDDVLPPASRIFLQTHVWPSVLRDGHVDEIQVQVFDAQERRIPVLLNGRLGEFEQQAAVWWTLFTATGRHRFEAELVAARNRAESASRELVQSQRFVQTVTDAIPALIAYWDRDLVCRFANRAYTDWFGKSPEQLVGSGMRDALGAALFAQNEPHVRAVLAGREQAFERTLTKTDGSVGHTWAHYTPDRVDGEVRGFFVMVSDVTQLKDIDAALRAEMTERERVHVQLRDRSTELDRAQTRLRAIYEATPAMLHTSDAQGRLLHVSDAWLARLGYGRDEVLGRRSSDFLAPASRARALEVDLPAFYRTGRCDDLPMQMVCRSGEILDVLLSAILECDAEGAPVGSLAVIQDVTLRRRAEQELAREHERLRNLVDSTSAGTWEWNVQTGEVLVNARWATILGHTLEELGPVDNRFRAAIAHPDELEHTRALLRDHFAGRAEAYVAELRLQHRDGSWVWVEDRGRLVTRTPDGRPEWMFGIHVDIGARKRQEQALRRSEELLNRTGAAAGVGGWELDLATSTLTWSAQTRRIHGVADDYQPSLEGAIDFYAPEARPVVRAAVETAIATGKGWDLEVPFVQASGRRIHVRAVGHVEFEQGRATRLSGAFQDITEAVEQRVALRVAHQRMALATDSGGIGVWDIDLASQRLTVDAWMVRLYNLAPGEGTEPADLWERHVHPDDRAGVAQAVEQAIARQRSLDTEFRLVWADGSVRHVKVSARLTRDQHGKAPAQRRAGAPARIAARHAAVDRRRRHHHRRRGRRHLAQPGGRAHDRLDVGRGAGPAADPGVPHRQRRDAQADRQPGGRLPGARQDDGAGQPHPADFAPRRRIRHRGFGRADPQPARRGARGGAGVPRRQ
jgi:PAS domain S-box-containing protein